MLGKVSKLAGPAGTGLTIISNYHEHKDNRQKLFVSTAVDLGSAAGAAATGAAIGSFIVPPIGTVVGAAAGFGANILLNKGIGTPPKSLVDRTKDGINKAIDGTKDAVKNMGSKITGWFKN